MVARSACGARSAVHGRTGSSARFCLCDLRTAPRPLLPAPAGGLRVRLPTSKNLRNTHALRATPHTSVRTYLVRVDALCTMPLPGSGRKVRARGVWFLASTRAPTSEPPPELRRKKTCARSDPIPPLATSSAIGQRKHDAPILS
eukprot:5654920-Prymnesium_polylepis.1